MGTFIFITGLVFVAISHFAPKFYYVKYPDPKQINIYCVMQDCNQPKKGKEIEEIIKNVVYIP